MLKKPAAVYALFLLASAGAQLLLALLSALDFMVLWTVWLYLALPVCAFALPMLACRRGVVQIVACFPQALYFLLLPPTARLTALWWFALVLLALSALGAAAGHELAARKRRSHP